MPFPSVGLPQRIDEWRRRSAAQEDQDTHCQQDHDDWRQPPTLVVDDEVPKLCHQPHFVLICLAGKIVVWVVRFARLVVVHSLQSRGIVWIGPGKSWLLKTAGNIPGFPALVCVAANRFLHHGLVYDAWGHVPPASL